MTDGNFRDNLQRQEVKSNIKEGMECQQYGGSTFYSTMPLETGTHTYVRTYAWPSNYEADQPNSPVFFYYQY